MGKYKGYLLPPPLVTVVGDAGGFAKLQPNVKNLIDFENRYILKPGTKTSVTESVHRAAHKIVMDSLDLEDGERNAVPTFYDPKDRTRPKVEVDGVGRIIVQPHLSTKVFVGTKLQETLYEKNHNARKEWRSMYSGTALPSVR